MVFFTGLSAFSQENYTKHTVSKGETITQIAAHYHIKSSAIYALNPDAQKGIKFKSALLIPTIVSRHQILPVPTQKKSIQSFPKKHFTA